MDLKKISYRPYSDADFEKVFIIFYKFQDKVEIQTYKNMTEGHSDAFRIRYLITEFGDIIRKNPYKYVGLDENDEIIGFACFKDSEKFKNEIELVLTFKDEKISYHSFLGSLLKNGVKKEFPNKRIFAILNQRAKFEKYLNFLKKRFNAKVLTKDSFGNLYVEFKNEDM